MYSWLRGMIGNANRVSRGHAPAYQGTSLFAGVVEVEEIDTVRYIVPVWRL